MTNKLSDFDVLECPNCHRKTEPHRILKNRTVVYEWIADDCEKTFRIDEDGDLIE